MACSEGSMNKAAAAVETCPVAASRALRDTSSGDRTDTKWDLNPVPVQRMVSSVEDTVVDDSAFELDPVPVVCMDACASR